MIDERRPTAPPVFETPERRPCKLCGAPIFFAETERGKKMPLDSESSLRFRLQDGIASAVLVYQTHWATCPKAKQMKERKR